jgi:hypothetical protein
MQIAVALILAAWLGAAILFAAVIAPAAFAVLPSPALAGALVGGVLPSLFVSGLLIGLLALVATSSWRRGAGVVMAAACAIDQFVVAPAMAHPVDPRTFGRLHGASVALFGVAMVAALAMEVSWTIQRRKLPVSR